MVKFSGNTDNPDCKVLDRLELEKVSVRCIGPGGRAVKQLTNYINTNVFTPGELLWLKSICPTRAKHD